MKTMPFSLAQAASAGQEAVGRDDEAALALDGLDDDRGNLDSPPICFSIMVMARLAASAPVI